jgi:hypothetical protein
MNTAGEVMKLKRRLHVLKAILSALRYVGKWGPTRPSDDRTIVESHGTS